VQLDRLLDLAEGMLEIAERLDRRAAAARRPWTD
jgi:hypothetical protein